MLCACIYVLCNVLQCSVIIPLTQDGAKPLFSASFYGQSEVVNILIKNGADSNLAWKVYVITMKLYYRLHLGYIHV